MAQRPTNQDLRDAIDRMVSNDRPSQNVSSSYSQQSPYSQQPSQKSGSDGFGIWVVFGIVLVLYMIVK